MAIPGSQSGINLDEWWVRRSHLHLHQDKDLSSVAAKQTLAQRVEAFERELIVDALVRARGNQTTAARELGTTKRIIQYKIRKYAIYYTQYRKYGGS